MASTTTTTTSRLIATIVIAFILASSPICEACCGCTTPTPATPTPVTPAKCPLNTLKLGVCADVLGLVHAVLGGGSPSSGTKCCALLKGLVDLEAAACLCTALKANVLGINLNVPIALSVLLSACEKNVPAGYQCP